MAKSGRKSLRIILVLTAAFASIAAYAMPPGSPHFSDQKLLIVTHPSTEWDDFATSRSGTLEVLRLAKLYRASSIVLRGDNESESYFHSASDHEVRSEGGELGFTFDATFVITAGGYFEQCQSHSVSDVLTQWEAPRFRERDLTVAFYTSAIYQHGSLIKRNDPYYSKAKEFQRTLGSNIFTLAQMIRLIDDPNGVREYLSRYIKAILDQHPPLDRPLIVRWGKGAPTDPVIFEQLPQSKTANEHPLTFMFIEDEKHLSRE